MEKAMRIYQVLVIGSFVALAVACKDETADTSPAPAAEAPANDVGGQTSDATPAPSDSAYDANGRPAGAVDPIRTPEPNK
jgi:hypothetical protein